MSTIFMSSKGGNCTTVTAAAFSVLSAQRNGKTLLIDLCGDVPAVLGLPESTGPGISPDQQFVSVTVHKTFQPTSIKAWLSPLPLRTTVTMMLEPPMVLE